MSYALPMHCIASHLDHFSHPAHCIEVCLTCDILTILGVLRNLKACRSILVASGKIHSWTTGNLHLRFRSTSMEVSSHYHAIYHAIYDPGNTWRYTILYYIQSTRAATCPYPPLGFRPLSTTASPLSAITRIPASSTTGHSLSSTPLTQPMVLLFSFPHSL